MKKLIQYILIIYGFSYSQALIPTLYKMKDFAFDTTAYKGLKSNMVSDIVQQGDTVVWLGTGSGLAVLKDSTSMYTINSTENLSANLKDKTPVGGVTAIAAYNKTLIAAFAKSGENITLGNGLIYTLDATGESIDWTYFEQPIDTEKDSLAPFAKKYFKGLPITVKEANVTYDAAITKDYIWIASWAGGLRRYNLALKIWERVPLPQDGDQVLNTCEKASYENNILKDYYLNPRDPVDGGNHNHKAFSVVAYADTVWVGTANGINRGIIGALGCVDWVHYTSANNGLSGGFVVDLAVQKYKGYNIIWGATVAAEAGETNGVSFTVDNGYTWNSTLIGKRAYNIDASGSIVLVASSSGLWKTLTDNPLDIDKPWARYNQVKQAIKLGSTGVYDMDEILSDEIVGVSYDTRSYYSSSSTIWIGSWDGLARAMDSDGTNWKIYRANFDPDEVYAYPNPFSPYEHNQFQGSGYVHIHADIKLSLVVKMDIFNFGMEPVLQKQFDRRQASTGSLKWDGKDKNGRMVDNGTYFIRLEYDQKVKWIKLIVIK